MWMYKNVEEEEDVRTRYVFKEIKQEEIETVFAMGMRKIE